MMLAGLFLTGCASTTSSSSFQADGYSKVDKVNEVQLTRVDGDLQVVALGEALSSGWGAARLIPAEPALEAGVYHLALVAAPPEGQVVQAITPLSAKYLLSPVPRNLKAVTVIAEDNEETANLP